MEKSFEKKELIKKSQDFSGWYTDVILKAKLADYAPVRGCQIIRPYGYAIWENIQRQLDSMIRAAGVENAYFPLFIPYSFLKKEKEHVSGFSPQLAVVTHGGGKKLTEPLVIRPTSETIMYATFSKWVKSWRDLPILINQWCNIVRWEKRTYLFLRTLEFLWQEGHTVHATEEEAKKEALRALKMYQDFVEEYLAIPAIIGRKSASEKFAGGKTTYAIELLMPDGKALQGGTSHELGQNFSKVFNIRFQDKKGGFKHVWQTSWGTTTRLIGALIMVHGDDQGLIIPPKISPVQAVIVPILKKDKKETISYCRKLQDNLQQSGFSVILDDRDQYSAGWKFNEWELKGIPLRIEVGKEELEGGFVTLVRRDNSEKSKVKKERIKAEMRNSLQSIQKNLYKKAQSFLRDNTSTTYDYNEFKKIMKGERGFLWAPWCENPECEAKIKQETKATTRALPLDAKRAEGKCLYCGKDAENLWLFAQAY